MRILLAEDEKDLSKALVAVLEKNHYTVDAVYNGQDAIDYVKLGDYDAAIFDIMMPKKSGIEALRELRLKKVEIPILLLTAKSEVQDKVEGLDSGADDYLTKPFSVDELLARVRTMTRRKSKGRVDNIIRLGNISLDVNSCELVSNDNSIFLANKEFQLMEMLMTCSKQYLSAERIFEKIWGYEHDADMSVVWVNISNLRKKLRKLKGNLSIVAKRNLGYKLEVFDD